MEGFFWRFLLLSFVMSISLGLDSLSRLEKREVDQFHLNPEWIKAVEKLLQKTQDLSQYQVKSVAYFDRPK